MRIIGIDCATDPKNVGLALSEFDGSTHRLLQAHQGSGLNLAVRVSEWVKCEQPALIAFDAPLGWPRDMGAALKQHFAGEPIEIESNLMFRRETDRFVKRTLNKQPLDVGADRIARKALAALKLLNSIRVNSNTSIPLAWNPVLSQTSAIEVYPAATLTAHVMPSQGYKQNTANQVHVRSQIIDQLAVHMTIKDRELLLKSSDTLDAAACHSTSAIGMVGPLNSSTLFPRLYKAVR